LKGENTSTWASWCSLPVSQPHMTLPPPKKDLVNQKSTQNISERLFRYYCGVQKHLYDTSSRKLYTV
jgi:hypothetical protein